eukprot:TRINITY_DN7139_c0_g2_i4.p1 TRINITY_DN7139_c0_g2~~TRINITY_DN7139_c0_g2_i4.p1  ORF type:complete len:395 (-),score=89.96 TRINITY_DN7139_c0_g2_i4:183-1367(-)
MEGVQSNTAPLQPTHGINGEETTTLSELPTEFSKHKNKNIYNNNNNKKNNKNKNNKPKVRKLYVYGNYKEYYSSRTPGDSSQEFSVDPRMNFFKKEWFEGRDCLDIGCNAGHLSIYIAYNYQPRSILGVDIDPYLVKLAQNAVKATYEALLNEQNEMTTTTEKQPKRIKFSDSETETTTTTTTATSLASTEENQLTTPTAKIDSTSNIQNNKAEHTPQTSTESQTSTFTDQNLQATTSTPTLNTTSAPSSSTTQVNNANQSNQVNSRSFPDNISIREENYVQTESIERFDTVLCMSVTKWIHFNWGDEGVKKLFQKIFSQLNPGGIFILEPQPWASYRKKHSLTPQIKENYQKITFKPAEFVDYLLSIGFVSYEVLCKPEKATGFDRDIYLFRK